MYIFNVSLSLRIKLTRLLQKRRKKIITNRNKEMFCRLTIQCEINVRRFDEWKNWKIARPAPKHILDELANTHEESRKRCCARSDYPDGKPCKSAEPCWRARSCAEMPKTSGTKQVFFYVLLRGGNHMISWCLYATSSLWKLTKSLSHYIENRGSGLDLLWRPTNNGIESGFGNGSDKLSRVDH